MNSIESLTDGNVAEFYRGQSVFVTGATGFMGKVLVEKLLRSCPDLDTLYLLIRSKKNEHILERTDKLLADQVFQRLSKREIAKVVPVAGDISLPGLGLSVESRKLLSERVSIVFHSAAVVRFTETLRETLKTNLGGTQQIIALCKEMSKLKVMMYVSTAFSQCVRKDIEEKVYDMSVSPQQMLSCVEWMNDDQMEVIAPHVVGGWPNYYSFSKALSENLVKNECGDFRVAIFRPSLVVSSMTEPLPGWVDNLNGPTGIVAGLAMGAIRSLYNDLDKVVDIIPVDLTINSMISNAWDAATNGEPLTVYNYVTSPGNPIKWRTMMDIMIPIGMEAPPINAIWCLMLYNFKSKFWYKIFTFLLHTIPAIFMDMASALVGKKKRMVKLYQRIDSHVELTSWFVIREWNFSYQNVKACISRMSETDKLEFPCDVASINWPDYLRTYYFGVRKYMLKDDVSTIPAALKRYNRFYYVHRFLQCIFGLAIVALAGNMFASKL